MDKQAIASYHDQLTALSNSKATFHMVGINLICLSAVLQAHSGVCGKSNSPDKSVFFLELLKYYL